MLQVLTRADTDAKCTSAPYALSAESMIPTDQWPMTSSKGLFFVVLYVDSVPVPTGAMSGSRSCRKLKRRWQMHHQQKQKKKHHPRRGFLWRLAGRSRGLV